MNTGDPSPITALLLIGVLILILTSFWKIFAKAGRPGWLSLIPVVNLYNLIQIAGRPGWWILLFLIPVVNFVVAIVVTINIANKFGKSTLFGVGMIFLPIIFYPLLAFSDATYGQ